MKRFIVRHLFFDFYPLYAHRLTSYREKPIIYEPCCFVILLMQRADL